MSRISWRRCLQTGNLCFLLMLAPTVTSADPLILSKPGFDGNSEVQSIVLTGNQTSLGTLPTSSGFSRQRFSDNLRVRGWQVADDLYFGQAKVADRWGIGLLLKKDKVLYGVNHRGLQITREF